jgi:hypothetical protein
MKTDRQYTTKFARFLSTLTNEEIGKYVRIYFVRQHDSNWPGFKYKDKTPINKMLRAITKLIKTSEQ